MKKENIVKYTSMGVLAAAIIFTASKNTGKIEKNESHIGTNTSIGSISIAVPEGFHKEGSKIVKNPDGLVDATCILEEGYHLEQYEYDSNLFYVVKDGYHVESVYLVPDGYHLEGTTMIKDRVFTKILSLKK